MIGLKNRTISFRASILFGTILILFLFNTCNRFEPESYIVITTDNIEALADRSYKLTGTFINLGAVEITQHGFCWSEQIDPTTSGPASQLDERSSEGSFSSIITDLTASRTYYVRSYAISVAGITYGDEESFTTSAPTLPILTTNSQSNVTESSAQAGGNITDNGGDPVSVSGVCWSISQSPTVSDYKTTDGSGEGIFTSNLTGLTCETTYYFRAYATNSAGTAYGSQLNFTTAVCQTVDPPTVTTTSVTGETETTAQGGGNVTDDGGATITARGVCWNTTGNPDTSDPKTTDAGTTGNYASSLTGLSPYTTYYVKAYATNSAGTSYGSEIPFKTSWDNTTTINDYNGNQYNTIQIGDQIWMAEGLMSTHYADGTAIQLVTSSSTWAGLGSNGKAYCWYSNSSSWGPIYGALYTWAAAMNGSSSSDEVPSGVQGVCPNGWHLPSDAEWKQLEMYLGMSTSAANDEGYRGTDEGGKLKEASSSYWSSPNLGATNESGFTARPAGIRASDGAFFDLGNSVGLWTSTEYSSTLAWDRSVAFDVKTIWRFRYLKNNGFSVRCIKNE